MITFGEKLKHLRKKNHLTQKQLGILIGFSESCADIRITFCKKRYKNRGKTTDFIKCLFFVYLEKKE